MSEITTKGGGGAERLVFIRRTDFKVEDVGGGEGGFRKLCVWSKVPIVFSISRFWASPTRSSELIRRRVLPLGDNR